MKKVFDYIEANYQEGITLSDVAEAVGYSSAYLTNQVAKQTGYPINVWIIKRRMVAALPLLKNTNQTIEEISTNLGYQSACHFSRQFRQYNHTSPTDWRKKNQLNSGLKNKRTEANDKSFACVLSFFKNEWDVIKWNMEAMVF